MRSAISVPIAIVGLAALLAPGVVWGGRIDLAWSPVTGATGYRAYYGTTTGQYTGVQDLGNTTSGSLVVPGNCTTYFVALKAYNSQGSVSGSYSNEVSGWAHPEVTSISPTLVEQADQRTVNIDGANFATGAALDITINNVPQDLQGNPLLVFENVQVVSCTRIQALVTAEPLARGQRAMELGNFAINLEVVNPDTVLGSGSRNLEVRFDEPRADINRSDPSTNNRVDGKDLAWLAHAFNTNEGGSMWLADADLDGDGRVDGNDLAMLAARFGMCWGATSWSNGACN